MLRFVYLLWAVSVMPLIASEKKWRLDPVEVMGQKTEVFRPSSTEAWGYAKYEEDTFVVVDPKVERGIRVSALR